MTAEERAAWEREHPKVDNKGPKKSWKFMQKYWHKGAFFQVRWATLKLRRNDSR